MYNLAVLVFLRCEGVNLHKMKNLIHRKSSDMSWEGLRILALSFSTIMELSY